MTAHHGKQVVGDMFSLIADTIMFISIFYSIFMVLSLGLRLINLHNLAVLFLRNDEKLCRIRLSQKYFSPIHRFKPTI